MQENPEAIARAYLTPRYERIDRLDRYVKGTQYEGLPAFFSDAGSIHDRAPCIVYGIAKRAIQSFSSLLLGEGRFPQLTSGASENDEQTLDDDWGLSEEQSDLFDAFLNISLIKHAKLKTVFKHALKFAMSAGAVGAIVGIRRGLPFVKLVRSKTATPTFDAAGRVTELEIRFPYIEDWYNPVERKWARRCMLYRRVVDEQSDTVYLPAEGLPEGKEPTWKVDKNKSFEHALGFCPVIWYRYDDECAEDADIDGEAIHATLLGEIDAINLALSQRHKAALNAGDPQLYETGVDDDHNPCPVQGQGRAVIEPVMQGGKQIGIWRNAGARDWAAGGARRRKGSGTVWRYPDKDSRVGMLAAPGDALKVLDDHAKDLRAKLAEELSVVFFDPSEIRAQSALSGKALSFLFAHQIARCDEIRDEFADGFMVPCVDLLLRVCLAVWRRVPGSLYLPGMRKVAPLLVRFEREMLSADPDGTTSVWFGPRLDLIWGPYFEQSADEEAKVVDVSSKARDAGLVTRKMAVEKLRGVFAFGAAEEVVEAIEEEQEEHQASLERAADKLKAMGQDQDDEEPDEGEEEPEAAE